MKPKSEYGPGIEEITLADYLMGRDAAAPLTTAMRLDAEHTVECVNKLLQAFGAHRKVNSGYRPAAINAATPGASKKSNHMMCRACDLEDADGALDAFCEANVPLLEELGLWVEAKESTPTWCHVQILAPASGNRFFKV